MGEEIYGVDLDGEVTPVQVRDAIIKCFEAAHSEVLDETRGEDFESDEEFKKIKEMDIKMMVQKIFRETGGDFDDPTRESLGAVISGLEDYSKHFRKPEIIEKHAGEIMRLMGKLS